MSAACRGDGSTPEWVSTVYIPKHFNQSEIQAIHDLMAGNPLGALVTAGSGGLCANHIPFELVREVAPYGALLGHVARANPVWRETSEESEALVIFQGANAYVSPTWCPSKKVHGKVVPTWNYVVAHAYGFIRFIEEPSWLKSHVERLTTREESAFDQPWSVDDAPAEFTAKMLTAVVGIEIVVTRLEGKWKVSQNRPIDDQHGVAEGLRNLGANGSEQMAAYIEGQEG